jgi:hypothetical protein
MSHPVGRPGSAPEAAALARGCACGCGVTCLLGASTCRGLSASAAWMASCRARCAQRRAPLPAAASTVTPCSHPSHHGTGLLGAALCTEPARGGVRRASCWRAVSHHAAWPRRRVLATEVSKTAVAAAVANLTANGAGNVAIARLTAEEFGTAWRGERAFERLRAAGVDLAALRFSTILARAAPAAPACGCLVCAGSCATRLARAQAGPGLARPLFGGAGQGKRKGACWGMMLGMCEMHHALVPSTPASLVCCHPTPHHCPPTAPGGGCSPPK